MARTLPCGDLGGAGTPWDRVTPSPRSPSSSEPSARRLRACTAPATWQGQQAVLRGPLESSALLVTLFSKQLFF